MKVTYYGHSCFQVEVSGKRLLFDPFITPNEAAKHIDITEIRPDYILISHGHEDHVADALAIGKASGATFISNFEIVTWFSNQGITNYQPMNLGGKWKFDFGTVRYVSAIHSSTLPDGSSGGNPGGFVIESGEDNFYYSGDTALTMDMQLIPRTTKLSFAMLPIGDCFTMGIDEAMAATEFIKCTRVIGMHYDTFGFIQIDRDAALEKFNKARLELILMDIGESKELTVNG